jgi:hypothetical protein
MDLDVELADCEGRLGSIPRQLPLEDREYLDVPTPTWAKGDELRWYFATRERLLTYGRVTWGCLIQANSLLLAPGPEDCPAEVVYPSDPATHVSVEDLEQIALDLYALKGTRQADPTLARISDYLANERVRVFGLAVPGSVSHDTPCAISTVFVARKHLPRGFLSARSFPLLTLERPPFTAMMVPSRYWSDVFTQWWL